MPALSGRAHVNRFLRGNHFSSLNVINLNSPLVKLLPIINMEQLVILIECGILGGCHSRSEPPSTQLSPGEARPPSPAAPSCWEARSFRNLDGGGGHLHVAQPCPLARPQRTLRIKTLVSDTSGLQDGEGCCQGAGVEEYKMLFLVSIGVFSGVITRSLGSIRGLVVH